MASRKSSTSTAVFPVIVWADVEEVEMKRHETPDYPLLGIPRLTNRSPTPVRFFLCDNTIPHEGPSGGPRPDFHLFLSMGIQLDGSGAVRCLSLISRRLLDILMGMREALIGEIMNGFSFLSFPRLRSAIIHIHDPLKKVSPSKRWTIIVLLTCGSIAMYTSNGSS